jgi:CTP synthase
MTLLPHMSATGELKTKPTQHSVKELQAIGIQPDAIICRSDSPMPPSMKDKISLFCNVPQDAIIPLVTVPRVYEVPLILEEYGLGDLLISSLGLEENGKDMTEWASMVERMNQTNEKVPIALVGKYVELPDSYISVREALKHAGLHQDRDIEIQWVHSEDIEREGPDSLLKTACGIVVPGGFGPRGVSGMIEAARYARQNKIPYLGLCLGLQVMVVEYARNVLGLESANSSEIDPDTPHPVIDIMPEQRSVTDKGGTMRLGVYPCRLLEGSLTQRAYGQTLVHERHRHRFEVNNTFREALENEGLLASGVSPDGKLVEIVEVSGHPFMVGVQFHPEFCSRPNRPEPLFRKFVAAAKVTLREGTQPPLPLEAAD